MKRLRIRERPLLELDDIQATVLRERPEPYFGSHVLLAFDTAGAGRLFAARIAARVRSAAQWWEGEQPWISVAFSHVGLCAMDLPPAALASFPEAFRVGMAARSERLYDVGRNAPQHWERRWRERTVHAAVTVFAPTQESWRRTMAAAEGEVGSVPGLRTLGRDDFGAQPGGRNSLGYKDLISNPAVEGSGVAPLPGQGRPIKAGEVVLGYPGETGVPLPMPEPDVLGRNGTFVVLRKYHTLAGSFNRFLRDNASDEAGRELLAAKLVGRWRSGAPLTLAPDRDDPRLGADPLRNNDFGYTDDPDGRVVPLGAHMRRMNPRDSPLHRASDVNLHRIVRRATAYGPPYDADAAGPREDQVERGLHFIFLSARAMQTVEFLQQEWVNSAQFVGLGDERDPIVGVQHAHSTFTVPGVPFRRRIAGVDMFNEVRGGEYFFLPGLRGLRWLGGDR